MTLNTVFANTYTSSIEQNLVESLIIEAIQIKGIHIYYMPRTYIAEDQLYSEDVLSIFNNAHELECYIETYDGFEGNDFLSKFGLQINDRMNLMISKKRFNDVVNNTRPYEKDLIYLPLTGRIYEVQFVEHEKNFYQLGKNYVYELQCELAIYSSERIQTGNNTIDTINWDEDYSMTLNLGTGSGTFTIGEDVYQGSNLTTANTTALVTDWNSNNSILEVINIIGEFTANVNIIGDESGASYKYDPEVNVETDELEQPNLHSDNLDIENEADGFLDFSEINPFLEDADENI